MLRTEQRPRGSQFPQRDLKSIPRQPSQRNLLGTPAPSRPVLPGDLRQIHVPHAIGGVPDAAMRRPFPSRRFFVTKTSLFVACSFLGLTTGFTAGVVRRVLASRALVSKPQGMPTFQPVLRFTAHQGIVRSVAWSPDGMQLASGADDTLLLLWKPDGVIVQQIHHVAPVQTVAWSPGGKRLVTGSGNVVSFLDAASGLLLAPVVQAHQGKVTSVVWSAHGDHPVVSGARDQRAIVWETIHYRNSGTFTRHAAPIVSVTSSDATIASASEGGVIRIWNLDTLQEVHGFYTDGAIAENAAAFSRAGALAIGGHDDVVRVWEQSMTCQQTVANGQQCADAPRRGLAHTAPVRSLAWSPDGRYLASGGDDTSVVLWDTLGFTQVVTLSHDAAVMALAFSPDQRFLAVATGTSVQIWQIH